MMPLGVIGKMSRTAFSIFSSATLAVPSVSTMTETGSATPMA